MLVLNDLRAPIGAEDSELSLLAARALRVKAGEVRAVRILRKSLDARKKQDIHFRLHLAVRLEPALEAALLRRGDARVTPYPEPADEPLPMGSERPGGRIVVAGLGPAGLFAAWTLARYGYRPLVIERGRPVDKRAVDVERFWSGGVLSPESNAMFGEGGAGTFSDGKLTSRSKDARANAVLRVLAAHGAPAEIEYLARPHIGTDRLRAVVGSLRREIETLGGEVRFSTRLCGIVRDGDGALSAVRLRHGEAEERVSCAALVLAIGQGARDTYRMLYEQGVAMQAKPFAVGVRVEHPQSLIDRVQFGALAGDPRLGAAEYRLTARDGSRGVYTFCMCPGGTVVQTACAQAQSAVNGMSCYARDGENANAAIVVQVGPEDFGKGALDGVAFCERLEREAFLAGGGAYLAPASRVGDFLKRGVPRAFGDVQPTCRPGVVPADLWACLPPFVAAGVCAGLRAFAAQLRGFDLPDAVLTAVESRTSAPLRILRGERMESVSVPGLYPVGEGAGYAGGIVSAGIDGMRAAERIIARYAATAV